MPRANPENLTKLSGGYVKELVKFITTLQKIQEKACNLCPSSKNCETKKGHEKRYTELKQVENIPFLVEAVGMLTARISDEIYLITIEAMLHEQITQKEGTKINIE